MLLVSFFCCFKMGFFFGRGVVFFVMVFEDNEDEDNKFEVLVFVMFFF